MSEDTRVVYGACCLWWDNIDKVSKTPERNGISIPCCPHCGGVLMEMPSETVWWQGVDQHEKRGHPGYRKFIEWSRGRCFPTMAAAMAAYGDKDA